ncbi:hypothetical protein [Novosphingobium sp. 9U]|uniref:hypothetical protein n=1 Tax=Novosphingobium sp. 9U TaxID=2653158 RepID=UPI00135C83D5|nr:hypothetical protein [Novosphingobium sp. 9U]
MKYGVKSKSMMMLLPLLAACSGSDGDTLAASTPQLDTAVASQGVTQPAAAVKPLSDFDVWAKRLMADRMSPIVAAAGDFSIGWIGADSRAANVVVRAPRVADKATVQIAVPAAGADATPLFQAALTQLKKQGGGTLKVAPGEYVFRSLSGGSHFPIIKMADVDIQADNAHFVFQNDADGIFIQDSQRIRIHGAKIRDSRVLSGSGHIKLINGEKRLVLDQPLPGGLSVVGVGPVNEGIHNFFQNRLRAVFFPGGKQATTTDNVTFSATDFAPFPDGQAVVVKYTYYGNRAVYVRDSYTGTSEDIVLDGVRIGSIGGIGVLIKSRGRGFAIQNSSFSADAGRPFGTNFDGIHVIAAAGDILIRGNSILHTGDDPINLRSIIHKVTALDKNSVTINNDARLVRLGDELAFFNKDGDYLGRRVVTSAPAIGNSDTVTFGLAAGEPNTEAAYVRDINMTPRRFAVVNNTIAETVGRGMLIQVANGLIQGNTLRNLPRTAIRLLTSYDPWLEGAGAINVRITNNTIEGGRAELGFNYVTGIITSLGEVVSAKIPTNFHNGPLKIDGNKFVAPNTACLALYNAKDVVEQNNTCG